MKRFVLVGCAVAAISCNNTIKLAVPTAFKEQATAHHVAGSKKNKMSFGDFTSSKIKRGMHMSYPGWGRGFFLENLLWNQVGVQKNENVKKEKASFRYTLSDGKASAEVFGKEREMTRSIEYSLTKSKGILNSFEQTQEYQYVFSALIRTDTTAGNKTWELLMTNIYNRDKDPDPKILTIIKPEDDGVVTNGTDSFFIKTVMVKETENANGKKGRFPFKMLGGYEVRTPDGVAAIIDIIGSNVWYYNELESEDRLVISAIASAIFARRVSDVAW